jgi:hypothetical protein
MILSRNWNTPVPYWESLPLASLRFWIRDSNDLIEDMKPQK